MLIVKISADSNGAHANQTGEFKTVPDGYIAIPPELEAQAQVILPWIALVEVDGEIVSVSEDVESKTAWDVAQSSVTPEPTQEERLAALEAAMLEMILGGAI